MSTITKSETVRAEFSNRDFLAFNELNSRIVFANPDITSRKAREATLQFAVKFTVLAVKSAIGQHGDDLFINENEAELLSRIEKHIKAPLEAKLTEQLDPLLRNLTKINNKVDADAEVVTISQKDWADIMLKVIALRD